MEELLNWRKKGFPELRIYTVGLFLVTWMLCDVPHFSIFMYTHPPLPPLSWTILAPPFLINWSILAILEKCQILKYTQIHRILRHDGEEKRSSQERLLGPVYDGKLNFHVFMCVYFGRGKGGIGLCCVLLIILR